VQVGTAAGGNASAPQVIGQAEGLGQFTGLGGTTVGGTAYPATQTGGAVAGGTTPTLGQVASGAGLASQVGGGGGGTTNSGTALPPQGSPAQTTGGTLFDQLMNGIMPGDQPWGVNQGGSGYSFPWTNVFDAFMEYNNQQQAQNTAEKYKDPWLAEQSKYFAPLQETVTKGIGGTAYGDSIADATARKMSSMGYNMSTNQMHEVGRALDAGTNQRINALTPLATGRGGDQGTAVNVMNAQQGQSGALGYGLGSIVAGQQNPGGQPKQNLFQYFGLA